MKKIQLSIAILSIFLLACLSGVEGQYTNIQYPAIPSDYVVTGPTSGEYPPSTQTYPTDQMMAGGYAMPNQTSVGYPATAQPPQTAQMTGVSQYSQYYSMGTAAPNTHISAPQQFNISGNIPAAVYFSYQMQPVPYSQYMASPTFSRTNELWIKGTDSWAQYAEVPQGAVLQLLAISPNGGNGYIREHDPSGQMYNYNYFFYPYSELTFNADTPGRHTISFGIAGQPSNHVDVDVIGEYKPPSFYNPPSYYNPYMDYWGWGPWFDSGEFGFGGTSTSGGTGGTGGTGSSSGGTGGGESGEHGNAGEHGEMGEQRGAGERGQN
jgi:uncharacterized membrane protein YgcG